MRVLVFLILLVSFVNAQLTETFSNFYRATGYSQYSFDSTYTPSDSVQVDLRSNETNLTWVNGDFPVYSQMNQTDPLYSGGPTLQFDGTNDYFSGNYTGTTIHAVKVVFYTPTDMTNGSTGESLCHLAGDFYGFIAGICTGSHAAEVLSVVQATGTRVWNEVGGTIVGPGWHVAIALYTGSAWQIYLDGVQKDNAGSGTVSTFTGDALFKIGKRHGVASELPFSGNIAEVKTWNSTLSAVDAKEETWLASGWESNSGGVVRDTVGGWKYHQGVITDTIYYNTKLKAGKWKVQVDIAGNSSGETYRVLTSADASTWTDIASGTAPATSTTTTVTGAGLGYIGLAVSSATDTVFFDNLTVTLLEGGGFRKLSGWNKFKGF